MRQRGQSPWGTAGRVLVVALVALVASAAALAGPPGKSGPAPAPPDKSGPNYADPLKRDLEFERRRRRKKPKSAPKVPTRPSYRPLKIHAKEYREGGPPLAVVSETSDRHFRLTKDGAQIVFSDAGGLWVAPADTLKPRRLGAAGAYFILTADDRFALVPGAAWRRLSLSGKDGPIDVAPKLKRHSFASAIASAEHLAFLTEDGTMHVASVIEGTTRTMPVEVPSDHRCHAGAASARAFSDDGRWLTFQHGCKGMQQIRTDGSDLRDYGFVNAIFVDEYLVGSRQYGSGAIEVRPLNKGKSWEIQGISLGHGLTRVPGKLELLQLDAKRRLVHINLRTREVRVLYDGGGTLNGVIHVTPDGRHALFATMLKESCAVYQADLTTGAHQRLALVENGQQCFLHALGNDRGVLFTWSGFDKGRMEAIVATVDLNAGVVTQLGPVLDYAGGLQTAGETVVLSAGNMLYAVRP